MTKKYDTFTLQNPAFRTSTYIGSYPHPVFKQASWCLHSSLTSNYPRSSQLHTSKVHKPRMGNSAAVQFLAGVFKYTHVAWPVTSHVKFCWFAFSCRFDRRVLQIVCTWTWHFSLCVHTCKIKELRSASFVVPQNLKQWIFVHSL